MLLVRPLKDKKTKDNSNNNNNNKTEMKGFPAPALTNSVTLGRIYGFLSFSFLICNMGKTTVVNSLL